MTRVVPQDAHAAQYAESGFAVVRVPPLRRQLGLLRSRFQADFASRFTDDPETNRNLIKRFGDSFEVARLFASPEVAQALTAIGLREPVFCGPVVTHYTSHDLTGQSYGLPFHQDWRSMGSSDNSVILWFSLTDCSPKTHSLEVVAGAHGAGLIELTEDSTAGGTVLSVQAGDLVMMSPFLPHRTHVHPDFSGWKLSLSRRVDDLACPAWPGRKYANAYGNAVDRALYKRFR